MNVGIHSGLIHRKHADAMGMGVWLFMWCVLRQTRHDGLVLGGAPITYGLIRKDLDYPKRTLRRWLYDLRTAGYIEVSYLNYRELRLRVLNPKKYLFRQLPLGLNGSKNEPIAIPFNGSKNRPISKPHMGPNVATHLARSGHSKQSGKERVLESTTKPSPLPPATAAGGPPEVVFQWALETVAVQMGRRRRLPSLEAYVGGRADDVARFLTGRGFPARIITKQVAEA